MKPRIFVSSTFYDLKYVREDLKSFIENYGFEPLLFEEGDIGYEPGKPLDESCYEAMANSDFAVLIIGGQYGSKASKQDNKADKCDTKKTDDFISITRKEFRKAIENGVPVFAYIDANVHAEYEVFKCNRKKIDKNRKAIQFRAAKDVNVFYFIDEVYNNGNIDVEKFTKISDIKEHLSKQWADMMKRHFDQLKERKEIESIKTQINRLQSLVDGMSTMLDAVGEKVINDDNKLGEIKLQQSSKEIFGLMSFFTFEIEESQGKSQDAGNLLQAFISASKTPIYIGEGENKKRISFEEYYSLIERAFLVYGFYILEYYGPEDFDLAKLMNNIAKELTDEKKLELVVKEIEENYNKIILSISELAD